MDALKLLGELTSSIKIDTRFYKKVNEFRMSYLINNSEFFSSALTGTVPLHFKTVEVSYFFEDLCELDEIKFQRSRKDMDGVDLSFKVTSDSFNLLLTYLAHKALSDTSLKEDFRIKMARELYLIFLYRTLAALVSSRFSKYQATDSEASATYEALSNKFILKRLKSWAAYCEYRADKVLDKKSPAYKRAVKPKDTKDFLTLSSGMQTSMASTFNAIFSLHVEEKEKGEGTTRTSQVEDQFGEEVAKDSTDTDFGKVEGVLGFLPYPTFINQDAIRVVAATVNNFNPKVFDTLLRNLQVESRRRNHKLYEEYVRASLVWTLKYLRENRGKYKADDLLDVLNFIKGGLSSSRTVDKDLLELRKEGVKMISDLTGKKDRQLTIVHRNALSLYLYIVLKLIA